MSQQTNGSAEEVTGPLVFSCGKCRTIVGDSYSLFHSNEEQKTLTLSAASNIQRIDEIYTSYEAYDQGSSYFCYICLECQNPLGRYYTATTIGMDNIREKFTFDVDSISSYELGKAQHGRVIDPRTIADNVSGEAATENTSALTEEVLKVCRLIIICLCYTDWLSFNCSHVQIQHVIVDLATRLAQVEQQLYEAVAANNSDTLHTSSSKTKDSSSSNSNSHGGSNNKGTSSDHKRQRG